MMGRRTRILGPVLAAGMLLAPAPARAHGSPISFCEGAGCVALAAVVLVPPTFLGTVDGYYTVKAYLGPPTVTEQSGRNAIYWTAWQGAILQGIAGANLLHPRPTDLEAMMSLWAVGTWPTSLSAHGAWFAGGTAARGVALGAVTLSDGVMLVYDSVMVGSGERVGPTYAVIETIVSAMQVGFGATTMARADREDRWKVGAFTLLPTALFLHGTLSLAIPEREEERASAMRSKRVLTRRMGLDGLQWGVVPVPTGFMFQAVSRW
ncbi:MAG: hypothetical protein QM784_09985 [Polyangiaceae bacterium]